MIFENVFNKFINYIKIEYDDNTNFDIIKTQINNILQNEITQLKNKLLATSNIDINISIPENI